MTKPNAHPGRSQPGNRTQTRSQSQRLSRRSLLRISAAAAAAIGASIVPMRMQPGPPEVAAAALGGVLTTPPERSSNAGVLQTSLEARVATHTLAGRPALTAVYEGAYPGPTLRVRAGDRLKIRMSNQLADPTNLHVHGMHVSPAGRSDNIFLHIDPGDSFDYEYAIPADHPSGLYWYHPHLHGLTTEQLSSGMAGALIVEGELDQLPGIEGVRERLLLLHATQIDGDGKLTAFFNRNQVNYLRTVNGQINPSFSIHPGETQRLRIGNVSDSTWFRLKLDGHQLHQIAKDGNTFDRVWSRDEILIGPAERVEVLVRAGEAGSYPLRTLPFDQGFAVNPEMVLATMISDGAAQTAQPLPANLLPFTDLSKVNVDRRREISFQVLPSDDPQRAHFEINSQLFDENRTDYVVALNATEEWVLRNPSNVFHPFHIHINPFQVTAVNGLPVMARGYEDTVTVPPHGEVTIRSRFTDFTGRYVFHCHILPHEDGGMMSVVEVVSDSDPLPTEPATDDASGLRLTGLASRQQFLCPIPRSE
jgi:suppressor of ftsI